MGMARKAGARHSRWSNFITNRNRVAKIKGATVPGTGGRHGRRKNKSGSNKSGSLSKLNLEWGATARKQEDDQRGINNRARRQAIEDQVASNYPTEVEMAEAADAARCWDDDLDFNLVLDTYEDIWERDLAYDDMWSDEGDIYSGTYQGDL